MRLYKIFSVEHIRHDEKGPSNIKTFEALLHILVYIKISSDSSNVINVLRVYYNPQLYTSTPNPDRLLSNITVAECKHFEQSQNTAHTVQYSISYLYLLLT